MGWSAPPKAPQCPACKTSVFPAESFMAADRKPFHKKCVKCKTCTKVLTSATLNEHQTQLYCQSCYVSVFMPQKPGGESYGGIVTPEDLKRKEEEERKKLEKAKRAKAERRCPTCDMKTYAEDSIQVSDVFYHKACLKCVECGRGPDSETPMMLGPKDNEDVFAEEELEPFCKFCFAKRFKLSVLNVADSVTIL
eukprot:GFUD01027675.1.p1 GENE.GFUD01027675.1~~GFUD01027675.1.p1  ORF type:complete len:214 (+),score=60.61 GFUD01027675.1:62-643(+)